MEDMFKNLGNLNLGSLFEGVQKMQQEMQKIKAELEQKTAEGSSGGDMVKVLISGNHEIRKLDISPEVIDPNDKEMLQDLIIAAINDGMRKASEMVQQEMSKLTGGINIPGMNLNDMFS